MQASFEFDGMMKITPVLILSAVTTLGTSSAYADVCDYRPSQVLGSATTATAAIITGGGATVGAGAKLAGVYTLVNASSGLTMVGGTWAGASAAGTAGILAGTGGVIGSVVAFVTAPVTIVVGAVTAAGIGAFEGACFFTDTRITDYDEVNAIVRDIAVTAPNDLYRYIPGQPSEQDDVIQVRDPDSPEVRYDEYRVENLYIVNGVLKHRDWGPNTTIGLIAHIQD